MNVFQDTLRRIAERVEGTRAVSLVGVDGIPFDSYVSAEGLPMDSLAAESGSVVKAARAAQAFTEHGPLQQLTLVFRPCRDDPLPGHRGVLSAPPAGPRRQLRPGRFELRKAAAALEKELM